MVREDPVLQNKLSFLSKAWRRCMYDIRAEQAQKKLVVAFSEACDVHVTMLEFEEDNWVPWYQAGQLASVTPYQVCMCNLFPFP